MARLIPVSLGERFINTTTDMQAAAPAVEITRLLRMLGASPAKVAGLVLFEALWLALLATMLGILGGHGLVELIGHWLQAERRGLGASAGAGCGQFGGFAASAGRLPPGCHHAAQQPVISAIF